MALDGKASDFSQDVYTYLFATHVNDTRLRKIALTKVVEAEPTLVELRSMSARHQGYFKSRRESRAGTSFVSWEGGNLIAHFGLLTDGKKSWTISCVSSSSTTPLPPTPLKQVGRT